MHRAEVLVRTVGKMQKATFWRPRFGKKSRQAGRNIDVVQDMLCEAENETKIVELLQARASEHQGIWQDVKTNSDS